MARTFSGATADRIQTSAGGCSGFGYGTIVAILKRTTSGASGVGPFINLAFGVTGRIFSNFDSTDHMLITYGAQSTSTFTVLTTDNWVLLAASKATGTSAPSMYKYVFSTDTLTVESKTATANSTTSVDSVNIGNNGSANSNFKGDIAILGYWSRVLTQDEIQGLAFSLQAWHNSAPTAYWILDQDATTQKVNDLSGNGANESSITGTSVSSNSVPVFSYGSQVHPVLRTYGAVQDGDATLLGIGSISAAGIKLLLGTSGLSGIASFTSNSKVIFSGIGTLSGNGSLTSTGILIRLGDGSLIGVGSLSANGLKTLLGSSTLLGVGSLSGNGILSLGGSANLVGNAFIIADTGILADATLEGFSFITVDGTIVFGGPATLIGNGSIVGEGVRILVGTSTLSSNAILSVPGIIVKIGTSTLLGNGVFTSNGIILVNGIASLIGNSELIANVITFTAITHITIEQNSIILHTDIGRVTLYSKEENINPGGYTIQKSNQGSNLYIARKSTPSEYSVKVER